MVEQGECGHLADPRLVQHCLRHWLTMGLDVVLPIPQLLQTVDQAVAQLFGKQGVPLPPRDASGDFVAGSGDGSSSGSGGGGRDAGSSGGGGGGSSGSSGGSTAADCPNRQPGATALWLVPLLCLLLVVVVVRSRPSRSHRHAV